MASLGSAMSFARSTVFYQGRSLRVVANPAPVNFSERRSILAVLERYGPIEVFRNTPNHPGSFIFVTKTKETATALESMPSITYSVTSTTKASDIAFRDVSYPDTVDRTRPDISTTTTTPTAHKPPNPDDENGQQQREFSLHITRNDEYNHAGTFEGLPENDAWPSIYTSNNETFMSATLKSSLPRNMAAKGLAHWENDPDIRGETSKKSQRLRVSSWLPKNMLEAHQGDPKPRAPSRVMASVGGKQDVVEGSSSSSQVKQPPPRGKNGVPLRRSVEDFLETWNRQKPGEV